LQQMGKIGPFGKSRKVFWHIQKRAERFFRTQKNIFEQKKHNKSSTKATENGREKCF
jgi:hypothetical protein